MTHCLPERLEISFLPPYCPDCNTQEQVWAGWAYTRPATEVVQLDCRRRGLCYPLRRMS